MVGSQIKTIISALVVILIVGAVAGTFFADGTAGFNATNAPDAPTWLITVAVVVVAVGLLFVILKTFGMGGKYAYSRNFKLGNRGQSTGAIAGIIGALVVLLIAGSLAGDFFADFGTRDDGLGNATANPDVPTWLPTVAGVVIAVGLLLVVLRIFGLMKYSHSKKEIDQ